jgi:hypothetical protein
MKVYSRLFLVSCAIAAVAACDDNGEPQMGTGVAIAVNALTLPGIGDACYSISVLNSAGDTLMSETSICAGEFGNGIADISYVGPCDAQNNPNTVVLTLNDLYDDGGSALPASSYVNPCPAGAECQLDVACVENEDVPVTFNLTIMRDLGQGFVDVAVNFDDIFCSAKVDCGVPGEPIELLHDGAGTRVPTAVVGLACSGGPEAAQLYLYRQDVVIDCGFAGTYTLDPTAPGELPGVVRWQPYVGSSTLDVGGAPAQMGWWNLAIAPIMQNPSACVLKTTATASETRFADGLTPAGVPYPVITVDVPFTNSDGTLICGDSPLGSTGVRVDYVGGQTGFAHERGFGQSIVAGE